MTDDENEKKPGWFQRFIDWIKETRQMWLRRNIIKKIAKLTPVGPEIDLDTFMGTGRASFGRSFLSTENHTQPYEGKVVEESYPFAKKCEHGTISRGTSCPKKIEYQDGSFTEIQILGNEECQRAFRELFERQMFPEGNIVICPHCKKNLSGKA